MALTDIKTLLLVIGFSFFLLNGKSQAVENLSLSQYLAQVKAQNTAFTGSSKASEGAFLGERQADLSFTPQLFASAQMGTDQKIPLVPLFTYEAFNYQNYSLGVSQVFTFGPEMKFYYQLDKNQYLNPSLTGFPAEFYDARPVMELSFPLLQNGFGRGTRAQQEVVRFRAQAQGFSSSAELKQILISAEDAYWRLSLAKETIEIQEAAVERAKLILDRATRQTRMNLGDRSDLLQAEAAYRVRSINLKQALDQEKSTRRKFNATRNAPLDSEISGLDRISPEKLISLKLSPSRPGDRVDVKVAEANLNLAAASAKLEVEQNLPTLTLYGKYALNGRNTTLSSSFSDSYQAERPSAIIGVNFSMPLNLPALSDAKRGAEMKAESSSLIFHQKQVDQDKDWADLIVGLAEAQETLKLNLEIETIQKNKVENERNLQKQARSTTFQVIQFEQDYANAQLARVQLSYQIISLLNQVKLYSGAEGVQP